MTNQTRSAVHDAATKAETLAYNLANASSLASVLSEVLDKELGSTIEGQSFAAPITLLDKLKEDGKGLERRAVRAASRHARQSRQHFINTFQERMKPFISTMMLGIM